VIGQDLYHVDSSRFGDILGDSHRHCYAVDRYLLPRMHCAGMARALEVAEPEYSWQARDVKST